MMNNQPSLKYVFVAGILLIGLASMSFTSPKSEMQKAIDDTIDWLKDQDQLSFSAYMTYEYVQKKFGTDNIVPKKTKYLVDLQMDKAMYERSKVFLRLADQDLELTNQDLDKVTGVEEHLLALAVACDAFLVPESYMELWDNAIAQDPHSMNEGLLAMMWIQEKGCLDDRSSQINEMKEKYASEILGKVNYSEEVDEGWVEGLAFLYYAGYGSQIREDRIEMLLKYQNDDGSWNFLNTAGNPSQRAAVLAIWALLEVDNPDTEDVPWNGR